MNTTFWNGRRVYLTGHTGFKGSWMSLWLQSLQAEVRGVSLPPPTEPSLFDLASVSTGMSDIRCDIRDAKQVRDSLCEFAPEVVIHMAAQALVRPSYLDPINTYAANVMGTVHVLDAVRKCPSVRAVLVITSDKCYENREFDQGYTEADPMGGYDPYSSSKGCAELVTAAYRRSYFHPERHGDHGVAVASVRAGNVIGGGDWAVDRLVPDAMRAYLAEQPFVVRFPEAIRPWQHVLEPLSGYLQLLELLCGDGRQYAKAWNFGPDPEAEQPVRYLAEKMTSLWGRNAKWEERADPTAPHEAHYLKLDTTKVRREVGWRPRFRLDDALAYTVAWYQAFGAGKDMKEFTIRQIADYSARPQFLETRG